jgi:hypothetical protein
VQRCAEEMPPLMDAGAPRHVSACWEKDRVGLQESAA